MRVDPELYIVEVRTERAGVVETFQSSIDFIPPPPQPLRLYKNTIYPFHFIYVRFSFFETQIFLSQKKKLFQ